MIRKVIHYCWFGENIISSAANKCIESWRMYLPEYEIIEWNENNFDVNMIEYTKEAYKCKKYAFVSDFARFYILYNYGGIYMDVDVEIVKSLNELLINKAFTGFESDKWVAPGLILAAEKNHETIGKLLEGYESRKFINEDGTQNLKSVVEYTTLFLLTQGLILNNQTQEVGNMKIYASEYFAPKNMNSGRTVMTSNTFSIHHYAGSWLSRKQKLNKSIKIIFGLKFLIFLSRTKQKFKSLFKI